MCVCSCVSCVSCVCGLPSEARRECRIPWNWSPRVLWTSWCWGLSWGPLERQPALHPDEPLLSPVCFLSTFRRQKEMTLWSFKCLSCGMHFYFLGMILWFTCTIFPLFKKAFPLVQFLEGAYDCHLVKQCFFPNDPENVRIWVLVNTERGFAKKCKCVRYAVLSTYRRVLVLVHELRNLFSAVKLWEPDCQAAVWGGKGRSAATASGVRPGCR